MSEGTGAVARRLEAARRVAWRYGADARRVVGRRGSARTTLESFGTPDRSDAASWTETTADRHDEYRRTHAIAPGRVAAVCVSMRPQLLDAVVANIARQVDVDLEVIFVANTTRFDIRAVERAFADLPQAVILHPPARLSLGAALNRAMERTDARFVAKFDDDDLYGPHFLADSLRAHGYAGAGVVGKHTYYARIERTGRTYLRFPLNEFRYSGTLAGGTLVLDRDRIGQQRFADISLGEDRDFLARCHRNGHSTFAADRFNFVQMRTGTNSWVVRDHVFLSGAVSVDATTVVDR